MYDLIEIEKSEIFLSKSFSNKFNYYFDLDLF